MSRRERLTQRSKEAKKYDNVDPLSLNNPFEDPDPDQYELNSPDHFQEMPDMRAEWQKDVGAYDEETNFMMPLDDVPSWWGQGPKMASMKAEACLKIAESIFPDAVEDFVDAQAVDLMELPDAAVLNTLKRLAFYKEEELRVNALVGKQAGEEEMMEEDDEEKESMMTGMEEAPAEEAPEATEAAEEMPEEDPIAAMMGEDMEETTEAAEEAPAEEAPAEEEAPEAPAEDEEAASKALMEELEALEKTQSQVNPSTEFGNYFDNSADVEDITFGNSVTASEQDLLEVFQEDYASPNHLRKSASVNNTSNNLKLSEHFGGAVPGSSSENSLWGTSPNVEDAFK